MDSTGNFHKHLRWRHVKEYAEHHELEFTASHVEANVSLEYEGGSYDDKVNQSTVSDLIVRCNFRVTGESLDYPQGVVDPAFMRFAPGPADPVGST